MKIFNSGEIVPCCDFIRDLQKNEMFEIDPVNVRGEVTTPWLRVRQLGGFYAIMRLNYCPSCGAKTEVEGVNKNE